MFFQFFRGKGYLFWLFKGIGTVSFLFFFKDNGLFFLQRNGVGVWTQKITTHLPDVLRWLKKDLYNAFHVTTRIIRHMEFVFLQNQIVLFLLKMFGENWATNKKVKAEN